MNQPVPSEEEFRKIRERVLTLAREVEQLSSTDVPPPQFFMEFLKRVVPATGAQAAAVWLLDENGRLNLSAQINLQQTGLKEIPGALGINEQLLTEVLQSGEARTIGLGGETRLPTQNVLVLAAVHREKKCVGVVELFQRADIPEKAQAGYMQFLEQMCGYASRYLEGKYRKQPESADLKNRFWTDFEQLMLRVQRSLSEDEVADSVASDSRSLLGVDRVSVATRAGAAVRLRAVSGQSSVNQRANLVVAMTALAKSVIQMGETLVYTGRIEGLAPQIEEPLAAFVQESGSRMVMVVPTYENQPLVREQGEEAEQKQRSKTLKPTGCLIIEQMSESEPGPQLEQRAELLADHAGAALWNARRYGRIFGIRLWTTIGASLEWFRGRKLIITASVLGVLAAIVATMMLIQVEYPVKASGKLMPVNQHAVFSTWDGIITREGLLVDGNQQVESGQLLVVLENDELDGQIEEARASLRKQEVLVEAKQEEIRVAESQRNSADTESVRSSETSLQRLLVELQRLQGDEAVAERQLQTLVERRTEKLRIKSPATGSVPNFQLRQMLEERPVRTGDYLFDVMDEAGDWHMELLVEEKRMGYLLRAQRSRADAGETIELPGNFVLASNPEQKYECRLTYIASRSTTDQEVGTAFELTAGAEDGQELPPFRIGTEVTVRFYCGKTSLAWWCFGDVVEFLQRYLWF